VISIYDYIRLHPESPTVLDGWDNSGCIAFTIDVDRAISGLLNLRITSPERNDTGTEMRCHWDPADRSGSGIAVDSHRSDTQDIRWGTQD